MNHRSVLTTSLGMVLAAWMVMLAMPISTGSRGRIPRQVSDGGSVGRVEIVQTRLTWEDRCKIDNQGSVGCLPTGSMVGRCRGCLRGGR